MLRRVRQIDIGTGHQQVTVTQQSPVTGSDIAKLPSVNNPALNINQVAVTVAVWREQRITLGR